MPGPRHWNPRADTGPCSLAQTVPATIVLVDDDFDLLLDDGRRVALAGIELPSANGENAKLHALAWQRLSNWLAGAQVYLAALAPAPDRWGRLPAQVIAAADSAADSPSRFRWGYNSHRGIGAFSSRPGCCLLRKTLS